MNIKQLLRLLSRKQTRIPYRDRHSMRLVASDTNEYTTNSTSEVDMVTLDGFSIPAEVPILLRFSARKTAGDSTWFGLGLRLNAIVTAETPDGLGSSGAANAVNIYTPTIFLPPRVANYLGAATSRQWWGIPQSATVIERIVNPYLTAEPPTVPITEIAIRGRVGNASITGAVKDIFIYTLPTEVF